MLVLAGICIGSGIYELIDEGTYSGFLMAGFFGLLALINYIYTKWLKK